MLLDSFSYKDRIEYHPLTPSLFNTNGFLVDKEKDSWKQSYFYHSSSLEPWTVLKILVFVDSSLWTNK